MWSLSKALFPAVSMNIRCTSLYQKLKKKKQNKKNTLDGSIAKELEFHLSEPYFLENKSAFSFLVIN